MASLRARFASLWNHGEIGNCTRISATSAEAILSSAAVGKKGSLPACAGGAELPPGSPPPLPELCPPPRGSCKLWIVSSEDDALYAYSHGDRRMPSLRRRSMPSALMYCANATSQKALPTRPGDARARKARRRFSRTSEHQCSAAISCGARESSLIAKPPAARAPSTSSTLVTGGVLEALRKANQGQQIACVDTASVFVSAETASR